MTTTDFRKGRLIIYGGVVIHIVGNFWDANWHRSNSGVETPAEMLRAHFLIYLGIILILLGAALLLRLTWRWPGFSYRGFAILLLGGLLETVGAVWDVIAHSGGADSESAHSLAGLGVLLVLVGLLVSIPARTPKRSTSS